MKRIYLALLLAGSALTGCSLLGEDEEEQSRTEVLTDSDWHLVSYTAQTGTQAARSFLQPCDEDDRFRFMEDRTYQEERGAVICSNATNRPATASGNWSETGDVQTITVSTGFANGMLTVGTWDVQELTNRSLHIARTSITPSGETQVLAVHMER